MPKKPRSQVEILITNTSAVSPVKGRYEIGLKSEKRIKELKNGFFAFPVNVVAIEVNTINIYQTTFEDKIFRRPEHRQDIILVKQENCLSRRTVSKLYGEDSKLYRDMLQNKATVLIWEPVAEQTIPDRHSALLVDQVLLFSGQDGQYQKVGQYEAKKGRNRLKVMVRAASADSLKMA